MIECVVYVIASVFTWGFPKGRQISDITLELVHHLRHFPCFRKKKRKRIEEEKKRREKEKKKRKREDNKKKNK